VITRRQVETVSTKSRFRPEPVEKVLRLIEILRRLDAHEISSGSWLLKGGTALNLFYLDLPRLSIDVDLNFIGVESLEALKGARESSGAWRRGRSSFGASWRESPSTRRSAASRCR
jgi:predicted nucleotidyltransferase component of viral defense system